MSSQIYQSVDVLTDPITLSSVSAPTVLSSSSADTITISSLSGITNGAYGSPYTVGAGISNPWGPTQVSAKIQLNGEGADVEVNGWSLVGAVKRIEERLNILTPNPKLETEWAELRELGEQYRKLEQQIRDKQATWDRLVAMPKLDID
jgi:hypothetical protein